jgi:hypothetical protein
MIGHLLLGAVLTHIFWATVFVGWWLRLIHRSGEDFQQAIRNDFASVRESIRRAAKAGRN